MDSEDRGLQKNWRHCLTRMAGPAAGKTAIGLWIEFLRFTDSFLAGFKFSDLCPVKHHGEILTGANVHFIIAVILNVVVDVIFSFHSVGYFMKQK